MASVARSYRPVDRDQAFLLPPDMREWLPDDHLVWLVLDIVPGLDCSALHARHANIGAGRAAYDPEMLLALLIYAYCQGVRSSRQIQQRCLTAEDVAHAEHDSDREDGDGQRAPPRPRGPPTPGAARYPGRVLGGEAHDQGAHPNPRCFKSGCPSRGPDHRVRRSHPS
jgi:hypothetical protein